MSKDAGRNIEFGANDVRSPVGIGDSSTSRHVSGVAALLVLLLAESSDELSMSDSLEVLRRLGVRGRGRIGTCKLSES